MLRPLFFTIYLRWPKTIPTGEELTLLLVQELGCAYKQFCILAEVMFVIGLICSY